MGTFKAEMLVFHSNRAHSGWTYFDAKARQEEAATRAGWRLPVPGGTCRGRSRRVRGVDFRRNEGSPIACQPAFLALGLARGLAFGGAGGWLGFQLAFWAISQEKSPVSWPDWVPDWVCGL